MNFDDYVSEIRTKHNLNWPYTPDHPYRMLIIVGSESAKTNVLLNLIENQPDIDKIFLYTKDLYEAKYQYLINILEKVSLDHFDDPKAFIEYSSDIHDVYKTLNEYNPNEDRKILIVFDDMIADIINNKKVANELAVKYFRCLYYTIIFQSAKRY